MKGEAKEGNKYKKRSFQGLKKEIMCTHLSANVMIFMDCTFIKNITGKSGQKSFWLGMKIYPVNKRNLNYLSQGSQSRGSRAKRGSHSRVAQLTESRAPLVRVNPRLSGEPFG